MSINRGLWVPLNIGNVGTLPVEARLADAGLFESNDGINARSGIISSMPPILVQGDTSWSYVISPFTAIVARTSNEGVYRFTGTGATSVATTAAPGTNSRIDVIWVKQNDQTKGDANNLAVAGVTQGTVAASPVAPAIPEGALELARATVTAGAPNTLNVSIVQTFRYTAFRGQPITVRNATERGEITVPRVRQRVRNLAYGALGYGAIEFYDGTVWRGDPAPQGLQSFTEVTTNSGSIGAGFTVVNNVASFTFRGGRKYRLVWDFQYQVSAANAYANVLVALANVGDAASSSSGLTQLNGRVVTSPVASRDTPGRVEGFFRPGGDAAFQVKWLAQVPSGSMVLTHNATNPGYFYIEDLGAQF